jgi:hypothetical protein
MASGGATAVTTIIRPREAAAVGACRHLHISPRRDPLDSALYREVWRWGAVGWEWEASAVVRWADSMVVA